MDFYFLMYKCIVNISNNNGENVNVVCLLLLFGSCVKCFVIYFLLYFFDCGDVFFMERVVLYCCMVVCLCLVF